MNGNTVDNLNMYQNNEKQIFQNAITKQHTGIITNPGPDVAFRSDNLVWDFKDLLSTNINAIASSNITTNTSSSTYTANKNRKSLEILMHAVSEVAEAQFCVHDKQQW